MTLATERPITFTTFGEKTGTPIDLKRVVLSAPPPVPFLGRCLARIELAVENSAVPKDVAGRLRLSLPPGTTVVRFEFLRSEKDGSSRWYPASAVPKRRAKEVAYREKERGREVAAASDVASGSNVFEIDVFPLPYGKEVECRLECVAGGGGVGDLAAAVESLSGGGETEVVVRADLGAAAAGGAAAGGAAGSGVGAAVGESFGRAHFVCRIPAEAPGSANATEDADADAAAIERIAVVWDESASVSRMDGSVERRCERLSELAAECDRSLAKKSAEKTVAFEFFTFGVGAPLRVGTFGTVEELVSAIRAVCYDGGTDVAPLAGLLSDLAARGEDRIDAALIFTDGMDNLGRVPDFSGSAGGVVVDFPVHCVADGGEVNLRCLNAIAAASPYSLGKVFSKEDESYVPGVLRPQPVILSIKTDQSEDAFLEEVDDGFRCVPDHRLGRIGQTVGSRGALICGTLGDEIECAVTEVVAEVAYGREVHEFRFRLRAKGAGASGGVRESDKDPKLVHRYDAVVLPEMPETARASAPDPAALLGHLYAEELYREAERVGLKSGMDVAAVREELSIQYGFCSPESSLLMLYDADQFLENGILPPCGHPAFDDPKVVDERKKREELKQEQKGATKPSEAENGNRDQEVTVGEIGGPKTKEQKKVVYRLAAELDRYLNEPPVPKHVILSNRTVSAVYKGKVYRAHVNSEDAAAGTVHLSWLKPNGERDGSCSKMFPRAKVLSVEEDGPCLDELEEEGADFGGECWRADSESDGRHEVNVCMAMYRGGGMGVRAMGGPVAAACQIERQSCRISLSGSAARSGGGAGCSRRSSATSDDWLEGEGDDAGSHGLFGTRQSVDGIDIAAARVDRSAVAPAKDLEEYLRQIEEALKSGGPGDRWKQTYFDHRNESGGGNSASPSFFLSCARLVLGHRDPLDAIKIATNCLEMGIDDAQMLRSVGYFLLSAGDACGLDLALAVFDHVLDLNPCEPQSYLDGALARLWKISKVKRTLSLGGEDAGLDSKVGYDSFEGLKVDMVKCQSLVAHVLTHQWAGRFSEVEWPALILLHFVADFAREMNEAKLKEDGARTGKADLLPEWPCSDLSGFEGTAGSQFPLMCSNFNLALMVWLGWDTDKTDMDLHVMEPTGNEVYYCNRHSMIGGRLSRDFTEGYGPEIYILKEAMVGRYDIFAKYFASHQDSVLTGATSAVLWTIKKTGNSAEKCEKVDFYNVRMNTSKEKTKVASVEL